MTMLADFSSSDVYRLILTTRFLKGYLEVYDSRSCSWKALTTLNLRSLVYNSERQSWDHWIGQRFKTMVSTHHHSVLDDDLFVLDQKMGAMLSVKAKDSIPIDGIVISGRNTIDESSLTGKSLPIEKEIGGSVWISTINLIGYICIETSALAKDSAVARMVRLVEDAQAKHD
ncbi:hypothetical protein L7F22_027619 [Adiantum nelumboides]|nr:hypothetical protein [Adiantum nelumboides]